MPKPVIWTVDDDPDVLRAVERDLRRQYGDRYKVISADSGASALEAVKQLKLRNEAGGAFSGGPKNAANVGRGIPGKGNSNFTRKPSAHC